MENINDREARRPRSTRAASIAIAALVALGSAAAVAPAAVAAPVTTAAQTQTAPKAEIAPPGPPSEIIPGMYFGLVGDDTWIEYGYAGDLGGFSADQISFVYELDGDGVRREFDRASVGPQLDGVQFFGYLVDGIEPGNDYSLTIHTRGTTSTGQVVDSAGTEPLTFYAFGPIAEDYVPTSTVDGPSVTFSWDLTEAVAGQRANAYLQNEDFREVPLVGSVTYTPGYDQDVSIELVVFGQIVDRDLATYTATARTASAPGAIAFTSAPVPRIGGTATIGSVLTAKPGGWQPSSAVLAYQWLRDGAVIPGATASTYRPVQADASARLSVRVTGTAEGRIATSTTSTVTAPVRGGAVVGTTPVIVGSGYVGSALTAQAGTWGPAGTALGYRWLRDGVPITGATRSFYVPKATDAGTAITVVVTGVKSGSTSTSLTSLPTVVSPR